MQGAISQQEIPLIFRCFHCSSDLTAPRDTRCTHAACAAINPRRCEITKSFRDFDNLENLLALQCLMPAREITRGTGVIHCAEMIFTKFIVHTIANMQNKKTRVTINKNIFL